MTKQERIIKNQELPELSTRQDYYKSLKNGNAGNAQRRKYFYSILNEQGVLYINPFLVERITNKNNSSPLHTFYFRYKIDPSENLGKIMQLVAATDTVNEERERDLCGTSPISKDISDKTTYNKTVGVLMSTAVQVGTDIFREQSGEYINLLLRCYQSSKKQFTESDMDVLMTHITQSFPQNRSPE